MKKQQGFTLIELVIVVIILGLLGAAAVPRFLDATDDARDASVEGVAGGFASAVGLVRAEWELAGRPANSSPISYDGVDIYVGDEGYPTDTDSATESDDLGTGKCTRVFTSILQSPPTAVNSVSASTLSSERYIVAKNSAADECIYTLSSSTELGDGDSLSNDYNDDMSVGQGFSYRPSTGAVAVFKNN